MKSIKSPLRSPAFNMILFSWMVALLAALTIAPFFPHSDDYAFLETQPPPQIQPAYALFSTLISDQPVKMDESTDIDKISSPFVILSIKARSVEENLSSRNPGMIDAYLGEIEASSNPYFVSRARDLRLMSDYQAARYEPFITRAGQHSALPRNLVVPLVHAHLMQKRNAEAQALFNQHFTKLPIGSWTATLPPPLLAQLLRELPPYLWNSHLDTLQQQEKFQELGALLRIRPAPERSLLLDALLLYSQKEYPRAAQQLARIKTPSLQHWKDYLQLKIDARLSRQEALTVASKQYRQNKILYLSLLSDLGGILVARDQDALGLEFYARYLSEIESIIETRPTHPYEQMGHLLPLVTHAELYWQILYRSAWLHYKLDKRSEFETLMGKCLHAPVHSIRQSAMAWVIQDRQTLLSSLTPFGYEYTRLKGPLNREHQLPFLQKIAGSLPWSKEEQTHLTDLFHHGLFTDAVDYSRWLGDQYPDHETGRRTLAICEAIIQSRQNNHPQAFNVFKDAFPDYAHYVLPRYLGFLLLPLAHDTLINEEARKNNLDPLLVTSLIRQESFFRTNAVSPAEAYGLMQLLVRTAQEVNPFTGRITPQNLQNPNINIRLGCRYLRKLLDRYQNQTYLALAAYNAGPDRVDAWISQLGKVKPEEFIELIPFSETRLYIKNILRNIYFYRHYYPDRFPAAKP